MPCPGRFLSRPAVVQIIPAVAIKAASRSGRARARGTEIGSYSVIVFIPTPDKPGELLFGAHRLLAAVFGPLDGAGLGAQDAGSGFAALAELGTEEGADSEANAIVDVWIPADRLLVQRLPPDEDVVGRFAFEDLLELALQTRVSGGSRPRASMNTSTTSSPGPAASAWRLTSCLNRRAVYFLRSGRAESTLVRRKRALPYSV